MAIVDILDFKSHLTPGRPVVGLDPGEKTLGVAVSDVTLSIASPMQVIRRAKFTQEAADLFKAMDARDACGIVIGLPVNMDGTEGPRCQSNRALGRNILRLRDLPIVFWDERLSTAAVQRMLTSEADLSRAKRAAVVDRAAAAYILQGALDRLRTI